MPKNFPFYNPEEHQHIIRLLETAGPPAIITATGRNPEMSGGLYPAPLIEDGDIDIPSVYMSEEEGERLARYGGREAVLELRARRIPAQGCNVIARKGIFPGRRVVLCAHIDSKEGTPGALDNASGVVTLLLLAELLAGDKNPLGIEIVAFNGEDYYNSAGQVQYLQNNQGRLDDVWLNINLDGVGYHQGNSAYSLYECPDELAGTIRKTFAAHPGLIEGPPWYQGDHMMFVMSQAPALAITSENIRDVIQVTHSQNDRPELVDCSKLASLARALRDL
jgi:aminopeptidase YwaD